LSLMRSPLLCLLLLCLALAPQATNATTGRVIKVIPLFLDKKGRTALTPSLYDRDAYLVILRDHPEQRNGVRFDIEWRSKKPSRGQLQVILQVRGVAKGAPPKEFVVEQD